MDAITPAFFNWASGRIRQLHSLLLESGIKSGAEYEKQNIDITCGT
jgi:hypothetical protein